MEVHPPEHPIHSWRDFFIHIGTIVVGLLIAIGLEQTVEALHRRHELHETREAVHAELETNQKFYDNNVRYYRATQDELSHSLLALVYLQQHPGAKLADLPFAVSLVYRYNPFVLTAWDISAQTSGRTLLSREELSNLNEFHWELGEINKDSAETLVATQAAARYAFIDPDVSKMQTAQLATEINLV